MTKREYLFQKAMSEARARYGLTNMTASGPVSRAELDAAKGSLGSPKTHEEWLKACKAARERDGVRTDVRFLKGVQG